MMILDSGLLFWPPYILLTFIQQCQIQEWFLQGLFPLWQAPHHTGVGTTPVSMVSPAAYEFIVHADGFQA